MLLLLLLLLLAGDVACLYYSTANSRVFHGDAEPLHIDFALDAAPALEKVLKAYPKFVTVGRLPSLDDAQKVDVAQALVEAKLVMVKQPDE